MAEVRANGTSVFRTAGENGEILPVDHEFAWRIEFKDGGYWGMYFQDQTRASYWNRNWDRTNPLTIGKDGIFAIGQDGKGWQTHSFGGSNFGKGPPPQFEDLAQKEEHQVRTPCH